MAYQSLYRRYRPQKFSEIRGQHHVVSALQNAVVKGEVGHAYLLHGPRGTGKTTSARVLAKALNCENLGTDGEPCCACESCVAIEQGRSFDLHELDAASNNKVEDMRDLLGKVNLGTPGRAKVYILDEVHMLTSQAENALLKTLEEPPEHVSWVLATTEPHKVVETIRSRCQVFELSLLGADEMADHVRWVIDDAALGVGEDAVDHVVAAGGGSVRDTLSALDRVVAAGGLVEIDTSTHALLDALASRDVAGALGAIGDATGRGRDPRTIGEGVLAGLRDAFLTAMGSPPPRIGGREKERAERLAGRMSPAAMTRALETLGVALVEMRQAPDPRVDLEVAFVRLCRPDTDRSMDAVLERLDRLEQGSGTPAATTAEAPAPPPSTESAEAAPVAPAAAGAAPPVPAAASAPPAEDPVGSKDIGPAAAARRALAEKRAGSASASAPSPSGTGPAPVEAPAVPPPPPPAAAPAPEPEPAPASRREAADAPIDLRAIRPLSPTEVVQLAGLHLDLDRDTVVRRATDLLGGGGQRSAEDLAHLWGVLVDEYGPAPSRPAPAAEPAASRPAAAADDGDPGPTPPDEDPVVVDPSDAGTPPDDPDDIDLHDLVDAPDHADELIERLTEAFPGAELHTKEEPTDD